MDKFQTITSKAIPLPMKDVDTDLIIPAQFLTSISRDGYGQNLFRRLRDNDPNFPFNLPQYKDAQILVAQSNFGCGSSREHAVWALQGAGIKVVIASSFADIFFNNSAKNGLVLVQLTESEVEEILSQAAAGDCTLTVDLEKQTVTAKKGEYKFDFDSFRRHCILNGLDDIDYILSFQSEIAKFREAQPSPRERRHLAGTAAKSEGM